MPGPSKSGSTLGVLKIVSERRAPRLHADPDRLQELIGNRCVDIFVVRHDSSPLETDDGPVELHWSDGSVNTFDVNSQWQLEVQEGTWKDPFMHASPAYLQEIERNDGLWRRMRVAQDGPLQNFCGREVARVESDFNSVDDLVMIKIMDPGGHCVKFQMLGGDLFTEYLEVTKNIQEAGSDRSSFLLSIQRALWGMVGPDLRAVAVGFDGPLMARFIYDHPVGDEEAEIASGVETEVLADHAADVETKFWAEYGVEPRLQLQAGETWWAFMRKEIDYG